MMKITTLFNIGDTVKTVDGKINTIKWIAIGEDRKTIFYAIEYWEDNPSKDAKWYKESEISLSEEE